jgi:dTDP-glucose 4,6-dehydratase
MNYSEDKFTFIDSNIVNINNIEIPDIDVIINFAAETHVDNSIFMPEKFIESNVLGVTELLKYAVKNKISKFIHISTDEVYGSVEEGYSQESDSLDPSSPYSASKASAELICKSFIKTYGLNVSIVRPANNYGYFQQPEKLIPFSVANLLNNQNIEIYGDGKNIRHWLHVNDTSSAVLKIMENVNEPEIFNIGSGIYMNNIDLSYKLLDVLKLSDERITYVEDRPGHDFRYAVDVSKLKSLGWEPVAQFDEELENIVNWYIANNEWWKDSYQNILKNKRKKRKGLV